MPRFSSNLDRFDRNWRNDPFWHDLYPRWAEPIFKEGIDVKTNIINDDRKFAVEIDSYQFRPEELQVKTLDDTLLIEGRHEDVRDRDNYTKMYFVRKYQLPPDVEPQTISSSVDSTGRLIVEANKRYQQLDSRERAIPIESASRRFGSRSTSHSPRDYDSGRGSANDYYRADSRTGYPDPFLSPKSNNGYSSGFETHKTDANGMRHEARREQFKEEFRRTGSHQSIPQPISPRQDYRAESRLSGGGGGYERGYHRSASASRNEMRAADTNMNGGNVHLLRPAEELGGRSSSSRAEERTIRIDRS